ncbi:potassium channel subfamily U member 1 [Sphaerodactylus townsendi]|uniref:potassium channel subfamily U member 1 n=1 Tax=Sphaerodactylus townsendi TaxID=933632 RepID=UPI002027342E|nr:potassium channel subfamily U member 1 [Sphaerodactylus townsendi]
MTVHKHYESKETEQHCNEYFQSAFIGSCLSIFLGGILMILMYRTGKFFLKFLGEKLGIQSLGATLDVCLTMEAKGPQIAHLAFYHLCQRTASPAPSMYISWKRRFQDTIQMMLSAQTSVGRVLVILVFLFSIGSLIIYFINCYSAIQFCLSFQDGLINIDLFFNVFFLFYFGLRFLAASDKLKFWVELNSIVDFFTITPVCVSFYLEKNWLGLRFLRALRLLELPKILQFLQIIKSGTSIKLSKLLAVFVSTWLTAAGFLHWIENSGDPWESQTNLQHLSYFECLYMVMVTMSTVGYGDIVAQTTSGRCFLLFFIIGGLMLFANFIPEIADIVGSTKLYKGSYSVVKGRKFIIVCGDITLNSVTAFLRNFLSQDTGEITTEIIFLGENPPNLELETVLRCYSAYASFFQGSVLKNEDLQRVQIKEAAACLILADTCSATPYLEDTTNIMRVLSIKNRYANVRVIIQIIQSSNKVHLPKLPNWDWKKGDCVICFAELKLGLIAQSCLVSGLTTLLTRLFVRENPQLKGINFLPVHSEEKQGMDYKVVTGCLSKDFVDMTFKEVCRICFVKLNLILLAVQFKHGFFANSILINPAPAVKMQYNTMGFFIAKSAAEVKRARYYCKKCHSDIMIPEDIRKCHCLEMTAPVLPSLSPERPSTKQEYVIGSSGSIDTPSDKSSTIIEEKISDIMLDSTGMFHWCEAVPLEKALLKQKKKFVPLLRNHIVVCVFGNDSSPLIGLRNFVMPLRASNFTLTELKDIVFVGSLEYLEREWEFINNFPKLYLFQGSALSCADLKAVNIKHCTICVVLSAYDRGSGDLTLVDTKSILATLNIRSIPFKFSASGVSSIAINRDIEDIHFPQLPFKSIPIITELKVASNVQFFEQNMEENAENTFNRIGARFFRETVFSDSFLNSLLCTAYYNHHVLALLQTLVTGGTSPQLEEYLVEEISLSGTYSNLMQFAPRNRCKLALLPVTDDPPSLDGILVFFGEVYCKALDMFGVICFGVYRLEENGQTYKNRFVISRPSSSLELFASDLLFCLVPFKTKVSGLTDVVGDIIPTRRKTALSIF